MQYHPQEKEVQKSKMAVWGGLTNSFEKKRSYSFSSGHVWMWELDSEESWAL